jgi:hypothetical protein
VEIGKCENVEMWKLGNVEIREDYWDDWDD